MCKFMDRIGSGVLLWEHKMAGYMLAFLPREGTRTEHHVDGQHIIAYCSEQKYPIGDKKYMTNAGWTLVPNDRAIPLLTKLIQQV